MTGRELLAVIDEELDRLPPIYREPLVLLLPGGADARRDRRRASAFRPGTVKIRLERGRKKLGDALTRRGVCARCRPPGPRGHLPGGGVPAATGRSHPGRGRGQGPAGRRRSRQGGCRERRSPNKLELVAALVGVAAIGLGLVSISPISAEPQKPVVEKADPAATKPNGTADRRKPETKDRTISGRVLAADGKPIVAELFVTWIEAAPQPLGKTNADGTFQVTVSSKGLGWLVAKVARPRHGVRWCSGRTRDRGDAQVAERAADPRAALSTPRESHRRTCAWRWTA